MKNRIQTYIDYVNKMIEEDAPGTDWEAVHEDYLVKISMFQHERLIHLIVTVLFALLTVMTVLTIVISGYMPLIFLLLLFIVLLVPYIMHYYFLENAVQRMYVTEDLLKRKSN